MQQQQKLPQSCHTHGTIAIPQWELFTMLRWKCLVTLWDKNNDHKLDLPLWKKKYKVFKTTLKIKMTFSFFYDFNTKPGNLAIVCMRLQ